MKTYIVEGTKDGVMGNLLVTTNIEKAKAMIFDSGDNIEVWENETKLGDIQYIEEDGFYLIGTLPLGG